MTSDKTPLTSPGIRIGIPPLIFALCIVTALLLEVFLFDEIALLAIVPPLLRLLIGFVVAFAGFAFMGWGFLHFASVGTSANTAMPASQLVRQGAFAISRNPMYVGFVAILLGLGIAINSLPLIFSAPVMFVYLDRYVIRREEGYLQQSFGSDYAAYCSRVRRWL